MVHLLSNSLSKYKLRNCGNEIFIFLETLELWLKYGFSYVYSIHYILSFITDCTEFLFVFMNIYKKLHFKVEWKHVSILIVS